MKLYKGSR